MRVIINLYRSVDAELERYLLDLAVVALYRHRHVLHRRDGFLDAGDIDSFRTVELERLGAGAVLELQRQHAHEYQIGAVDALEVAHDYRLDSQQQGTLSCPVA